MAKTRRGGLDFDLSPIVEGMGLKKVIEQIGKKDVLEQMDVKDILENLTPAKRRELRRRLSAESDRERK